MGGSSGSKSIKGRFSSKSASYKNKALKKVGTALKGNPRTLKELAEKAGYCYPYTCTLYNELVRLGRTKRRLQVAGVDDKVVGDRGLRDEMIKSKRHSLREIARATSTDEEEVSPEGIRDYIKTNHNYNAWARGRAKFLVDNGESPGALKKYLPAGYKPKKPAARKK